FDAFLIATCSRSLLSGSRCCEKILTASSSPLSAIICVRSFSISDLIVSTCVERLSTDSSIRSKLHLLHMANHCWLKAGSSMPRLGLMSSRKPLGMRFCLIYWAKVLTCS
ncbi:hypothetical protein XELAEV_18027549mg, partial [Xenopus laevis]